MYYKKPFFITFEGIDGSGKTTQIKKIYKKLIKKKTHIHLTSEPTNGYIGKIIQEILLGIKKVDEHTLTTLFLSDRLEHILNPNYGILKYLKSNISILCDRYYFSSYAYHSSYVNQNWIIDCNKKCKEFLKPDLIFFLNISIEECLIRIKKRNKKYQFYEKKNFLTQIKENYLKAFNSFKEEENIFFINANQTEDKVFLDLWKIIKKKFF